MNEFSVETVHKNRQAGGNLRGIDELGLLKNGGKRQRGERDEGVANSGMQGTKGAVGEGERSEAHAVLLRDH